MQFDIRRMGFLHTQREIGVHQAQGAAERDQRAAAIETHRIRTAQSIAGRHVQIDNNSFCG